MAFRMTLLLPSGARLSMTTSTGWPVICNPYSTKLRYLNTSGMTVSNQYRSLQLQAVNRKMEPTYMYEHRHTLKAMNLIQRTKAADRLIATCTYLPQSNHNGSMRLRGRDYPVLQVYRNYSNGAPANPTPTDPKSSNAGTKSSPTSAEAAAPAQSSAQRVRIILREYGTVAVAFHISMSLCVLSVCYILVSNGLDVDKVLAYFNVEASTTKKGASTFAISYLLYKMLLPVRATVTIACVPIIVRSLRARGWMKGVAKATTK